MGVVGPASNVGMMPDLEVIITRDRVKWAISSLGLLSRLVQMVSFRLCFFPDGWKDVLVVLITKVGKPSHFGRKDYRYHAFF